MANKKKEASGSSFFVREKKFVIISVISIVIIILDQLTKFLIKKNVTAPIPIIKNIFQIVFVRNTGAGFGIFRGQQILLIFASIFAIGLIFFYYDRIPKNKWMWISIGLILGGTIGNLIDRIRLGYVTDFLDFMIWPSFNVADSAISVGAVILAIWMMRK